MEVEPNVVKTIQDPKLYLLNLVSSCLLKDFRFYDSAEQRRDLLISALQEVASSNEPEFVLQLAYYVRNKLYIRSATNFILAYAGIHEKTAPFLEKYFNKTVLLPSDFLDVCQWTQILKFLKVKNFNFASLEELKTFDFRKKLRFGTELRDALKGKFKTFTVYQLGKYCSESRRKKFLQQYQEVLFPEKLAKRIEKKKKKLEALKKDAIEEEKEIDLEDEQKKKDAFSGRGGSSGRRGRGGRGGKAAKLSKMKAKKTKFIKKHKFGSGKPAAPKTMFEVPFITMKDIIRTTHMKSPQYVIRSVLGKKYPENELLFQEAFKGENLVFDPTQANKRMKIETPITWETELSSKGNKASVWGELISANKLPYMAMMRNLRNLLKIGLDDHLHAKVISRISNVKAVENAKMFPFQYFSALNELEDLKNKGLIKIGDKLMEKDEMEIEEEKKLPEAKEKTKEFTFKSLLEDYQASIKKAIQIAVDKNLEKIEGHTLIFSDVSGSMSCPVSGKRNYGSVRTCTEVALLLGLMIKSKCEKSTFYIFSSPGRENQECFIEVDLNSQDILEDMNKLKKEAKKLGGGTDFPFKIIREHIEKNKLVNNIVILSDMMISPGYSEIDQGEQSVSDLLNEYRTKINPSLKIFSVDLRGYAKVLNLNDEFNEENYVRIFGMSDSVLKFISVKEKGSQIEEVKKFAENIANPAVVEEEKN